MRYMPEGVVPHSGFRGYGFMLVPATAQLITEMILGEPLIIDVSGRNIGRFGHRELGLRTLCCLMFLAFNDHSYSPA
jgi:glycine/D-amino acid oxidase-like deaminating enzyme